MVIKTEKYVKYDDLKVKIVIAIARSAQTKQ